MNQRSEADVQVWKSLVTGSNRREIIDLQIVVSGAEVFGTLEGGLGEE